MELAANVAWITCITTAAFSFALLASLITYYEPKHDALCQGYFSEVVNSLELENKEDVLRGLLAGLKTRRLQITTIPDLIVALKFTRGVVTGFLVASALLLLIALTLYGGAETGFLPGNAERITTITWFSMISLANTFICLIWVLLNTARLEVRYAIGDAFLLNEIRKYGRSGLGAETINGAAAVAEEEKSNEDQ